MSEDPNPNPQQDPPKNDPPKNDPPKNSGPSDDRSVPYHRFKEVNDSLKSVRDELDSLRQEREQAQEERAQKQGEWQKLAEKRQTTIQQKDTRIKELEGQIVRDRRYRAFVSNSSGLILGEALDDAFDMVTEEEWNSTDDQSAEAVKTLIQGLSERKPYLAAEAPRGAGSGGSRTPVLGHAGSPNGQRQGEQATGRQPIFHKGTRRRPWK